MLRIMYPRLHRTSLPRYTARLQTDRPDRHFVMSLGVFPAAICCITITPLTLRVLIQLLVWEGNMHGSYTYSTILWFAIASCGGKGASIKTTSVAIQQHSDNIFAAQDFHSSPALS